MPDHFKIECPQCGHPVVMRTTEAGDAEKAKTFKVWPSKENAEKIADHMEEMAKNMRDGFAKIFDKSLWK